MLLKNLLDSPGTGKRLLAKDGDEIPDIFHDRFQESVRVTMDQVHVKGFVRLEKSIQTAFPCALHHLLEAVSEGSRIHPSNPLHEATDDISLDHQARFKKVFDLLLGESLDPETPTLNGNEQTLGGQLE